MKKTLIFTFLSVSLWAGAQTVEKVYLFDFGGQGSRGTLTQDPGWNNITTLEESATSVPKHTSYDLKDSQENSDGYKLTLTTDWGVNGNSGGGGLLNPDLQQLGDLAVANATCDYIFNTNNGDGGRSFVISGLPADKGYRFTIFGSRSSDEVRIGEYIITGDNSWETDMQVAGAGLGANGENQRTGQPPVSDIIFPDAAGNITFWLNNPNNTYVPLSCMKMEQMTGIEKPMISGNIIKTFYFDFGSEVADRGMATSLPGWNNILANSGNDCSAGSVFDNIVDSDNNETDLTLTVDTKFTTNGYSTGLGLADPKTEDLGDLAVETATYDYFFVDQANTSGKMTLTGLDQTKTKSYRFYIFASRKAADARLGAYRLEGLNSWTASTQAAGNALDGSTSSQNEKVVLVSEPVFPDADGKIYINFLNGSKVYFPINCMKIEELSGVERPNISTVVAASLVGDGIADGESVDFVSRGKNTFELYVKTDKGQYKIKATDDEENDLDLDVELEEGINRISVNFNTNEVAVLPVTYFCVEGSAVGGWNTTGLEMSYIGKGKWNFIGSLDGYDTSNDSGRVNFVMNKDWAYTFKRVSGSKSELSVDSGDDIPLNPGNYDITVDLNNRTWTIENGLDELDPYRVTVMGSSVANGQGAVQDDNNTNTGYAYQYNQHLAERYENGLSKHPFYISNISIGGNSSVNLLNRFDDLEREFGKWVIYGISLGNEGIHGAADQEAIYNQFKDNMTVLIDQARALGKEVIVMNNYTRGDFVESDYEYVKKINDEIAFWDVPSINMLGAIDNGAGLWADGYQDGSDIYHPNTAGHTEFFYAMVPSMMDALIEGKTLTMERTISEGYELPANTTVEFIPDGNVHSFTLALSAKTSDGDLIATIPVDGSEIPLTITRSGNEIVALLPDKTTLKAPATENLDEIVLSQNYIRKMISLAVNENSEEETEFEAISPLSVTLGNPDAEKGITLGEVMFYRSSMHTASPFTTDGQLNKSSLEVYAPINEEPVNEAMSTVEVNVTTHQSTSIDVAKFSNDSFRVFSDRPATISVWAPYHTSVNIVNISGQTVAAAEVEGLKEFSSLQRGIYIVNGEKIVVK